MSHHSAQSRLEQFMKGELSPSENREVVRHLVSGCAACSETTTALWEVTVTGRQAPRPDVAEYDRAFDAAWKRAAANYEQIVREREVAAALCAELFRLSPHQQRLRVRNDSRFQTLAVCDAMIAATEETKFDDAAVACNQAEVAREITQFLDVSRYGAGTVADVKASAWAAHANALRNSSDYTGAVRALETARMYLDEGTGDPERKAGYLAHLGSLLIARSRVDEALAAYRELETTYSRLGDHHMVGRVQLKKAFAYGKKREPEREIRLLTRALSLLDPARDPRRQTIALHNLVLALIDVGRPQEASLHIDQLRALHRDQGGRLNLVRFHWLEGRLAHALGELEEAQFCYTHVRDSFIELEIGADAALASLDLAQTLFDRAQLSEAQERLSEAIPILKALDVQAEAMAAIAFLEQTIQTQAEGSEIIRQTAAFIRKAQTDPTLRFRPVELFAGSAV
ncbi:MAG: tetratricopeptide repeat protein [Thermoanaerobaculia bacterium]